MSEEEFVASVPNFIRKRLGARAKSRYPYDAVVPVVSRSKAFLITDSAAIHHILVQNSVNYTKPLQLTGPQGRTRAGAGLLTSTGEHHKRQRLLLQPVFRHSVMQRFLNVVEDRISMAVEEWRSGQELDVARAMSELSLSILLGTLFGMDFRDEGGRLRAAIRTRRRYTEFIYRSPLPFREQLPLRVVRKNAEALKMLDQHIYQSIRERRSGRELDDLVSLLINARYADGSTMTDQQVRDEVLTFTSTGHETLGDALGWTWYLLARHPDVDERLVAELAAEHSYPGIDRASGDRDKPRFVELVLSESLRLYPPTWLYARVPVNEDKLPGGQRVAPGTTLFLSPYVMHRHPRFFPDPERFDPERFRKRPRNREARFAYFPFGAGPHRCLGETFARMEGELVISRLAHRFRFETIKGTKVRPEAGITLFPKGGLRLKIVERSENHP